MQATTSASTVHVEHPASTGGLICAIVGAVLFCTVFLAFLALPFNSIAWILGARAVSRARHMGVGAARSAITAKWMGMMGTIPAILFSVIGLLGILAGVLFPAVSGAMGKANSEACALNGRRLYLAIVRAGFASTEQDECALWPRSEENKDEDAAAITGKVFDNSTDYFRELFDLDAYGTSKWHSYLEGSCDVGVLYRPGLPEIKDGRIGPENVRWCVAEQVTSGTPDVVPVLVSCNLDCRSLRQSYNGYAQGRLTSTDGKAVIVIRKNGTSDVIEPRHLDLPHVYGQTGFSGGPAVYLTPTGRARTEMR